MKHLLSLLLLVAALSFSTRAEAFTLSFDPPARTITSGDSATYTLRITDFSNPIFFTDYTVAVLFDSSILSFDSENFITGPGIVESSNPGLLLIDGISVLIDTFAAPLDLVSLTFKGESVGTSELAIAANVFADFTDIDNPVFFEADTVLNAQATVASAVPEPGTLILLGAGLAGLALWRRRSS